MAIARKEVQIGKVKRRPRRGGCAVGEEILRTEGIRGLFRGWALRGVWTAVGIEL